MPSSWEEHDGVRYLFVDQRSGSAEGYADDIRTAWRMREEVDGPVVVLTDVRGSSFVPPPELRAEIKQMVNSSARRLPSAIVLVGLEGVAAMFVRGLTMVGGNMRMVPARSWEQALSLVVREARRLDSSHRG